MTTKISGDNISAIANTGVKWNAVTVADGSTQLNASAGNGYFLDTNAGVIEVFLPSSPTRGDTVILADYASNFATNNVLVNTGGILIDSVTTEGAGIDYVLNTNDLVVELVYVDSSKGWLVKENQAKNSLTAQEDTNKIYITATGGTVTTSGDYKIHTFTGDGCFVVSCGGNDSGSNTVDYLVVAGGGAGGATVGGGGGAGGFRYSASTYCSPVCAPGHPLRSPTGLPVSATTYPITVGGGGAGLGPGGGTNGNPGSNSVFSTITSTGGGGGATASSPTSAGCAPVNPAPGEGGYAEGLSGGSGGGTRGTYTSPGVPQPNNYYYNPGGVTFAGGLGNTPPTSPSQGNSGGMGFDSITTNSQSGGGGGAISAGGHARGPAGGSQYAGGPGGPGAGLPTAFGCNGVPCGSYRYYAGGGGGGQDSAPGGTPSGGLGGGGAGGQCSGTPAGTAGTANSGGGGGGGVTSGAGGKGIVVIRYKFQ